MAKKIGALVAATTVALLTAAPAQADRQPETTERVYYTSGMTDCWKTPDASTLGKKAPLTPAVGTLYDATAAKYRGIGAGRGDAQFRWLRIDGKRGCYVQETATSTAVPDDLDPNDWTTTVTVSPGDKGFGVGALLSADDRTLRAGPSRQADAIAEVDEGTSLRAASWTLDGGNPGLGGEITWRAVETGGVVAWIRATSVVEVPAYKAADLTGTFTPEHAVPVYAQPARAGEPLGILTVGEAVPALLTPTLGWVPVALDGRVGWVSQHDLVNGLDEQETDEPGALDEAQAQWEEWRAEREAAKDAQADIADNADEPGLLDKAKEHWAAVKDKATGQNPVAKVAAKARLLPAGAVALLALLLVVVGHAATGSLRRGRSLADKALGAAAPGAGLALRHATIPAAIVAGLVAAWLAPAAYFQTQVLGAAGVLGLVLGFAVAHRIAALRGADSAAVTETARQQMTVLVLAAVGVGAGAHFVLGFDAAACVLLALAAAGAVAGWRTPLAVEPGVPQPVLNPTTVSIGDNEEEAR